MSRLRRRNAADRTSDATVEGLREQEREDVFEQAEVGERVTTVLERARRASEDTLAKAGQAAERLLAEFENAATAAATEAAGRAREIRRETEQLRAEADRYSTQTREAADAYAAEKLHDAEERVSRHATIIAEAGRFEERLQDLVTVFRGMTDQLEELLAQRQGQPEDDAPDEESLQKSLEEQIKR